MKRILILMLCGGLFEATIRAQDVQKPVPSPQQSSTQPTDSPSADTKQSSKAQEKNECAICSCLLPKNTVTLPCDHAVCDRCLETWLNEQTPCKKCVAKKRQVAQQSVYHTAQALGRVAIGGLAIWLLLNVSWLDDALSRPPTFHSKTAQ